MLKRNRFAAFPLLLAVLVAVSCSPALPPQFPAPDFMLEDIFTGKQIHLGALKGKPVMLYFFASW